MNHYRKKSPLKRLFDKFVEGVGACVTCVVVGTAIGFGIKAGCHLADAAAEAADDFIDPIDLDEDDLDEDEDDETAGEAPQVKNLLLKVVTKEETEDSCDDENIPEADGVTPAEEVEKMVSVTFPVRDSRGRFMKKTVVPDTEPIEEPVAEVTEAAPAPDSENPAQLEAPAIEETGEPAEENQQ